MDISMAERVLLARERIQSLVRRTPLEFSPFLSTFIPEGPKVYLKLESEQISGSFKARGAFYKLCCLLEVDKDVKKTGCVTASTGNHALACTVAMEKLGVPVEIFSPKSISDSKKDTLMAYKANLVLHGQDCVEAERKARQRAEERNVPYISPYNDLDVAAGQGTIGVEIFEDLPDLDAVFISVGGGGLIAGMAAYLKHKNHNIQVFGCQPAQSKVMYESIRAGRVVFEESGETLSDGTSGGIEEDTITFELCQKYVDDWILVTEEDIAKALYFILDKHHKVIEGSAGVAVAAYMNNMERFKNFKKVAIIICGANLSTQILSNIINKYR